MNTITFNSSIKISDSKKEILITITRYLCLFLFVYTAYAKLVDHERFYKGLANVHMVRHYAAFVSYFVPLAEVLISILLIVPKTIKLGLVMFVGMMIVFTVYIISALIWEPKLPCHCGGVIEKLSWMQHIWFNLAFIILALIALWLLNFSKYLKKQES